MTSALPDSVAGTWHRVGTRTGETNVLVTSITTETTLYEPAEAATLADLGASEIPARSLFTIETTFSPPLTAVGISPDDAFSKAAPKAKQQFIDTIEDDGLLVEGTRETLDFERPDGTAGTWYVLDVAYPVDPELGVAGTTIPAETNVAVWPTDTAYGMAGGTLPLEIPDAVSDAFEDSLDVDPERDRETITELVRTLETDASPSDQ